MKIALIGYGKMGQKVHKAAIDHGYQIVANISSPNWDSLALKDADCCIEFTNPQSAKENICKAANLKIPIVVGTTGWYDQLGEVKEIIETNQSAALYGPNFSVGVQIWMQLLSKAAKLMNQFHEYEAAGFEQHHSKKLDSPSGTALEMAKVVEKEMERIEQLPVSSLRCGSITGTHTLLFDSPCDQISITHTARNRDGFATGAIKAAEWLRGKKGLYTFSDYMHAIISEGQK